MDFFAIFLIIAVSVGFVYLVLRLIKGLVFGHQGGAKHCLSCGHEGPTKKPTKGSFFIELILWLCFLVPGLIYSIWRLNTRHEVCINCGGTSLVPLTSPILAAAKLKANPEPT